MRVLLDTNIVIHREANIIVNENIGKLFLSLNQYKFEIFIHQLTIDEISKFQDSKIRNSMIKKLESYNTISFTMPLNEKLESICRGLDIDTNDSIDTKILNELYCGSVDYLITEDKKILEKAKLLNISNKVKTINAFLEWIYLENPDLQDYKIKNIRKEKFGNIPLEQPFFDSFKTDYGPSFEKWYIRNRDKEAYVCGENDNIIAFLSLKVELPGTEDYSDIVPSFLPQKRLKIRTMKVSDNGYKIGERFLKIVFDNALNNKVDEIYVTLYVNSSEKNKLFELFKSYGFVHWGKKAVSEDVMVRCMQKQFCLENPMKTYPYLDVRRDVYLVCVGSQYHTKLFPDSILRFENPSDYKDNKPYSNAIRKFFITNSYSYVPKRGDILLFYRSNNNRYSSVVTTIGVVLDYHSSFNDFDSFYSFAYRRSVLDKKEMLEFWKRNKFNNFSKILDFLYIETLPKKINLDKMIEVGFDSSLLKCGIIRLDKQLFNNIFKLSGLDLNKAFWGGKNE